MRQEHRPPNQVYPRDLDMRAVAPSRRTHSSAPSGSSTAWSRHTCPWRKWKRSGQTGKADTIWRLAREPRFRWFGRFTSPRMQKKVRGFLDRVQCDQPGSVPLMVVMRHQGRACGRATTWPGAAPRIAAR